MKIQVTKKVEVQEEAEIPDVGLFYISSTDQSAMYGMPLNQRTPQFYEVEVVLSGNLTPKEMESLMALTGQKVTVVQVA